MKWLKLSSFQRVLGIFALLSPLVSLSQNLNVTLNQPFSFELEKNSIQSEKIVHESFKPILLREARRADSNASTTLVLKNSKSSNRSWVSRKLFHNNFIELDTGLVRITIDPIINFEIGSEYVDDVKADYTPYKNTRGFIVKANLGEQVSFESSFRENQVVLPSYLDQRTEDSEVAYGQGRWKRFKDDGYDFAMASAYLSYSPLDWINIQAGHGKHFVGNGHRSLLLSDLSFNYPFLRINTSWLDNKIQYQNLFSVFQDLNRLPGNSESEALFERKQAATHYLEYKPNNLFSFALFESVIFPRLDSGGSRKVGSNYWIPIIGLNSIVEGSNQEGNSLFGTNLSLNITQKIQLYNQFSITDENFNNVALQLGTKYFFAQYFLIQLEANLTDNYNANQLYTHYNESLNYPVQDNVADYIAIFQFQKNRWQTRIAANFIENNTYDAQLADLRQSFIINPSFNFAANIGVQYRKVTNQDGGNNFINPHIAGNTVNNLLQAESIYFYFGISTHLQNLYFNY